MVPATLRALMELQLAHLRPEDQTLLEAASVAGIEFSAATVAAAVERADEVVEARCAALARQGQFLQVCDHMEWPDGTVTACYSFRHALYQEAFYQRVPAGRQTRWHARIGTRLAQGFGEHAGDMAAALAMHFVRGRLRPQAVRYLRQAGDNAMARSAYREAVTYFEQALSALPHVPAERAICEQAIDLRLALGSALQPSGAWGRILAYLCEAESLAEALDDPHRLGQVCVALAVYRRFMGVYDQVIATAHRALALATASGDVVLQAEANNRLGVAYQDQGDYRRAIDCFRQALACFDRVRHRERFVNVLLPAVLCRARLAWCDAELGMFAEGRSLGSEGLRIAEAAAHPPSLMFASWGVGLLSLYEGHLPTALPCLERAVGLCLEADLSAYFPRMAEALGAAYTLAGRLAEATPLLTRVMEQVTALERVDLQARCSLSLGKAQLLAGHLGEAQALAEQALAQARDHEERGNQAYALRLLGDIAAQREPPDLDQATAHYRQALALADELGMRPLYAHCRFGLGAVSIKTAQREQACAELSAAIELYRALEMTFWLPQAEAAMASLDSPPS
jgi:tetratricopeptide (TPR) repeat protein